MAGGFRPGRLKFSFNRAIHGYGCHVSHRCVVGAQYFGDGDWALIRCCESSSPSMRPRQPGEDRVRGVSKRTATTANTVGSSSSGPGLLAAKRCAVSLFERGGLPIDLLYQQHDLFEALQLHGRMTVRHMLEFGDRCSCLFDFAFAGVEIR